MRCDLAAGAARRRARARAGGLQLRRQALLLLQRRSADSVPDLDRVADGDRATRSPSCSTLARAALDGIASGAGAHEARELRSRLSAWSGFATSSATDFDQIERGRATRPSCSPAASSGTSTRPPAAAASPSCSSRCSRYTRGAGVDARWVVIGRTTGLLRGSPNGCTTTSTGRRATAGRSRRCRARGLRAHARAGRGGARRRWSAPDDVVFLHDPQTAGMVAPLRETGAVVVWRCHVGLDLPNDRRPRRLGLPAALRRRRRRVRLLRAGVRLGWPRRGADLARARPRSTPSRRRTRRSPRSTVAAILQRTGARRRPPATGRPTLRRARTAPRGGSIAAARAATRTARCPKAAPDLPGLALGRAQGSRRGPARVRRARSADREAPPAARRARPSPRSPTTPRAPRSRRGVARSRRAARGAARARSTWPACRWTTCRRTRRWSTRSSGAPTSSCRRALPRGSG